jgi:thymidylate synthase
LLKTIAQQAGVSEAEIIRQAIDLHLGEINAPTVNLKMWEAEKNLLKR